LIAAQFIPLYLLLVADGVRHYLKNQVIHNNSRFSHLLKSRLITNLLNFFISSTSRN
jgi:hypothetical protein